MNMRMVEVAKLDAHFLEGKPEVIIKRLNDLRAEHGDDMTIEINVFEDSCYGYTSIVTEILVHRPEKLSERIQRENEHLKQRDAVIENKRAMLKQLKEELGEE